MKMSDSERRELIKQVVKKIESNTEYFCDVCDKPYDRQNCASYNIYTKDGNIGVILYGHEECIMNLETTKLKGECKNEKVHI